MSTVLGVFMVDLFGRNHCLHTLINDVDKAVFVIDWFSTKSGWLIKDVDSAGPVHHPVTGSREAGPHQDRHGQERGPLLPKYSSALLIFLTSWSDARQALQDIKYSWGPIFGGIHGMPWPPNRSLNVSGSCLTIFRCLYYINIDILYVPI